MPADERLISVVSALADSLNRTVVDAGVSEDELLAAIRFLNEVGEKQEFALLSDVLGISVTVDHITHNLDDEATSTNVLGPYYVPGAPMLPPPHELAGPNEPGEPLAVFGRVTDASSTAPLPGAILDVWQTDADGLYSNQVPGREKFHLRGKVAVDDSGEYRFRTVTPPPYEIPKDGPVGRLLRGLGRHAFRPAHLHVKVTCDGYQPLTTMVFFAGDAYLDSDTIGAVKPSLIALIERGSDREVQTPGDDLAPARCRFDIALRQASD
jgi:protocatechuate 3,4-dioxygenase beta subunit